MVSALITLLILIVIVGVVYYLLTLILNMLPVEEGFKQIARVLLILICVLVILAKALPLIGVSLPM